MKWLRQDPRLGGVLVRPERDGGETGDDHDFGLWADFAATRGELEPVHFRHDDVRDQSMGKFKSNRMSGIVSCGSLRAWP
mgnify:CR=1 FL=1